MIGVAKPRLATPSVRDVPRAAHEKIAADLAYDLGLPVPPVVLWRRAAVARGEERLMSISLVPFSSANPWTIAAQYPRMRDPLLAELSPAASAMVAFDSWVSNLDRVNDGNLVVATSLSGESRWAYLDYSNSMLAAWKRPADETRVDVQRFPSDAPLLPSQLEASLKRIEGYPAANVQAVIQRIPSDFLSASQGQTIVRVLLARQQLLRPVLTAQTGEKVS